MNDAFIHEALRRMREDGLLADAPIADGQLHRCAVAGKEKSRDGAYLIHADSNPSAWWLNWQSGVENTYCAKSRKDMTRKERKEFDAFLRRAREEARQKREAARKAGKAAMLALWNSALQANDDHLYLRAKNAPAMGDLRVTSKGLLLIPVYDADGKLISLQRIPPEPVAGKWGKFFMPDCPTAGGFYPIPARDGSKDGPLLIAEGYATAMSCCQATGYAALVTFNVYKFMEIGKLARTLYPLREIVLCADYDTSGMNHSEPGGIGVAKAREAAIAIGAYLAIAPAIDGGKADFNDIAARDGLARVKDVIDKALSGEPANSCPMPDGYSLLKSGRKAGLYFQKKGKDGESETIRLGPPLEVIADTRDAEGNDWGLFLKWHDRDGKAHAWAMPKTLLYDQRGEWFARLAFGGWFGNPSCKKLIASFLTEIKPLRRIRCVNRTGWHGASYVLPEAIYGECDQGELVLQSSVHNGLYQRGGTMDGWREIANLCAGNSRLGFALSCAFAGPLLKLAGLEGGGFSFEGPSSCGKTTALKAACSVWGPGDSHLRNWRTTSNGLEGVANLFNDNLLILDELSQADARAVDEAAYMLANGYGKTRAGRDGNIRKSSQWHTLILSSGELGLSDKLIEAGRRARAGQEVRFAGVPTDNSHIGALHGMTDAGQLVRRVNELCGLHYGHAGHMLLEKLSRPEVISQASKRLCGGIERDAMAICPEKADSQVIRVAMRFMLVSSAGTLARELGILPEDFQPFEYARECFDSWLEKRGGAGALEDAEILAQVRLFIEQHGQSRFQDWYNPDATCVNRVGFRKEDCFYCFPEAFKTEIIKGYSLKKAIEVLTKANWLKKQNGRNQCAERLPRLGLRRVYALNLPEDNNID